jgi:hypothetical protein
VKHGNVVAFRSADCRVNQILDPKLPRFVLPEQVAKLRLFGGTPPALEFGFFYIG